MVTSVMKAMRRLPVVPAAGVLILGLALLTGGCAHRSSSSTSSSSTSGMTSQELYNEYDQNNDNQITKQEWDQAYTSMDANGDGVVSHDEFNAARGGRR